MSGGEEEAYDPGRTYPTYQEVLPKAKNLLMEMTAVARKAAEELFVKPGTEFDVRAVWMFDETCGDAGVGALMWGSNLRLIAAAVDPTAAPMEEADGVSMAISLRPDTGISVVVATSQLESGGDPTEKSPALQDLVEIGERLGPALDSLYGMDNVILCLRGAYAAMITEMMHEQKLASLN